MITASQISKQFDGIEAVKDISVSIRNGEVFGLIGTNGAGKSTFLRMRRFFTYRMISIFCRMPRRLTWRTFITTIM